MADKFELFTDAAGKTRWQPKAGNGEIIAASRAYESKDSAKKDIASFRSNAPGADVDDTTAA